MDGLLTEKSWRQVFEGNWEALYLGNSDDFDKNMLERMKSGKTLFLVDTAFGPFWQERNAGESFTAEYEILRADLAGLFSETTEGWDNVQYTYSDSVKSLEQTDKDINMTFTRESKDTFDLFVAVDGSASKTRSLTLDEQVLKYSYKFQG